jgi:hypothetical protein
MWGFGTLELAILFGGVCFAVLVTLRRGLLFGVAAVVVVLVVVVPMRFRDRYGRHVWQAVLGRVAWRLGRARGQGLYVSGPLARVGYGTCRLPGLAAGIEALDALDGLGRPFALLWHRATDEATVVIETAADGAALLDDSEVDDRVATWGTWLAGLSYVAGLVGASVTVEAAPGTGARLRREVQSHLVPDAPAFALEVMAGIVDSYPTGSASISCRVALTWSMAGRLGRRARGIEEMAVDIGHQLPHLTRSLAGTGAGPGLPMGVGELAAAIRVAYEPGTHAWVEDGGDLAHTVAWHDCGPRHQQEHRGHLVHDGACSITWEMGQAPRGLVLSSVLAPVLRPHPKLARKRVTLLYRPHDPATSAAVVERDFRNVAFTKTNEKGLGAATRLALEQARATADEEARGAGLTRFAMLVTATVGDESQLEEAAGLVEELGLSARMALRRCWGTQGASFSAALPLGIVLASHLAVPEFVRELA